MRRYRVLMINDYGRATGGAELQMLALRDGLRRRGHEVRLFASDAALAEGFPILADAACRGRTDRAQVVTQTLNPSAWIALRRELRANPPDVVHLRMFLWQISPLVLPLLRGVPTLFQAAVYKAICPTGLKLLPGGAPCARLAGRACLQEGCVAPATWGATMLQLGLLRRWRGAIDRVAALSRRMAATFEAEGWGPVAVLGNGVDARPARPPLGDDPIVAYAGRLSREKGVETAIRAVLALAPSRPRLRLIIAGGGPLEAELRALAAPLGERVRFLGHMPRAQMEAAFDVAWVQLVPSLWHEPFGNVTTEAMMRGTAVVASDVGGQSDITRDGVTGRLTPPGDVAALAAALAPIVDDRALAERMGAEGRRVALTEYDREAVLDRLTDAYAATIDTFAARSAA